MAGATVAIASSGLSAEIATHGAELQRLTDSHGRDLLWNGDPAVWRGRAPILFPVIGMMINGHYRIDGKRYPMPKHGFARDSEFAIVEHEKQRAVLRLNASAETRAFYPFDFRLDLIFAIEDACLRMTAVIANDGTVPMPASFGFHPAFRWPLPFGGARGDQHIRFARDEPAPVRRIDRHGFLTPERHPTPVTGNNLHLRDDLFVDDALIFDALRSGTLHYGASEGPDLKVDFEDFPLLGIWTKPHAGYVCIEPWQGVADPQDYDGDMWDKPGIVAIPAGQSIALTMAVTLVG
jgi:galactose mutarotase-like enzyme